ncbi:SurA N-terminal domain-containing protein [Craterilacuibacter sp. RT1T]|uniref:SurA N-terminal domain-containing protein n=1 Tax=Craterilacuibacter sp. RT1T TaxID=2942211 RepID=UPI0020C0BA8A|nr:SurA N-terminal domain-containing protein [Craterilacuibacter sp. RT1T]MCL6263046.1 SurA N-terminal domain-containing protein [Craterilacuibacter sp. RT1T]
MFDFVHNNKFAIKIILGAVALTFVGFGVGSYSSVVDDPYLAKVGGQKIVKADLDRALEGQPANAATRQAALENLIRQNLVLADADASSLTVGSTELRRVIASIPAFQQDGKFSPERYKEFLASRYMTPDAFEARVLQDITLQSQLLPYTGSHFVSRAVAARMAALLGETRDVQAMVLRPQAFEADIKLDEAALKAYYDANKARFRTPDAVKLDYVVLSQAQLAAKVSVSDAEARKYYETHAAEFASEERRVSHILLTVDQAAKPEVKAKVKAEAEALLKEVRANPARFAELAKTRSQDPGSAANGGDLGFFARGAMVKPFEDVAFSLKKDQISEVVTTDFGYHILKLDEIKTTDFDAVKAQIIEQMKRQKATSEYRAAAEKLADLAYQHGDSLKAITDALGLPVEKTGLLERGKPGDGMAANPKLLEAVFSDDVLKKKHNSEPVEVGNNTLVVARVAEYQPAHQQTLAEVTPLIRSELLQKEGAKQAEEKGKALLAELKAGKAASVTGWGEMVPVSRRAPQGLPLADLRALFAAPAKVLPAYVGIKHDNGDYVIYRIDKLVPAKNDNPAELAQLSAVIGEMSSNALVSAYLESLRQKYPVTLSQQPAE